MSFRRLKRTSDQGRNDAKSFPRSNNSSKKSTPKRAPGAPGPSEAYGAPGTSVGRGDGPSDADTGLPDLDRLRVSSADGAAPADAGDDDHAVMDKENGMDGSATGGAGNVPKHTPNRPSTNPPSAVKSGFR